MGRNLLCDFSSAYHNIGYSIGLLFILITWLRHLKLSMDNGARRAGCDKLTLALLVLMLFNLGKGFKRSIHKRQGLNVEN